jgi:hypothetical protein
MKSAILFSLPSATAQGFDWRWRSGDHAEDSTRAFAFYAECAADAKLHGYRVELGRRDGRSSSDRIARTDP